jgi:hypothetical protein
MIPIFVKSFAKKKDLKVFWLWILFLYRKGMRLIAHLQDLR